MSSSGGARRALDADLSRMANQSSSYSASSSQSYYKSSYSSSSGGQQQQQRSQGASTAFRQPLPALQQQHSSSVNANANGYSLNKSASTSSLHKDADAMLKDLEGSLRASQNYIESHRSTSGPGGSREYHEYRSYSSGGKPDEFNLERQVQHMLPSGGSSLHQQSQQKQQQQQGYSAYKVQTNQYGSSGDRVTTTVSSTDQDRPGSRLKQNIDELDTLLDDLNRARTTSDYHGGGDYTTTSLSPVHISSDDYSYNEGQQGHVKKTVHSYNEHTYGTDGYGSSSRKPPSPSPRRRPPTTTSRLSPGPQPKPTPTGYSSSYSYSSSFQQSSSRELLDDSTSRSYPAPQQPYQPAITIASSPPPRPTPSPQVTYTPPHVVTDGKPTGASYYSKYHSAHTHQSLKEQTSPSGFPTRPQTPPQTQSPPKRVDQLLSEFDIHDSGFVEPKPVVEKKQPYREPSPEPYRPYKERTPPRDFYAGYKANMTETDGGKAKAKAQHEHSFKAKEKGKQTDSDGTKTAVVPICLPLCCAAPCVIM